MSGAATTFEAREELQPPKATVYTQVIESSQIPGEPPPSPQFWGGNATAASLNSPRIGGPGGEQGGNEVEADLCVQGSSWRGGQELDGVVDAPIGDLVGTVVSAQANYYAVRLDGGAMLPLCTRRDRLRKIGQQVMVGDRVRVEEPDWGQGRAAIGQVFERRSVLDRPPVANADQILLVFALHEPALDPNQLSRFLIKAESTGIAVCLCLSKCDLLSEQAQGEWSDRITTWGYNPVLISTQAGIGLSELTQRLSKNMTIVSGPSGVGKSSLINQLIPQSDLRVSAVSGKLGRGRHTTRHVALFDLPQGGLLADTPGFNQVDLDCTPEELGRYFPEVRRRLTDRQCQFANCRHREEPGCVVRGNWERYGLYRLCLDEALARETVARHTADPDATFKQKSGSQGETSFEPRLNTRKYRQESRRSQQQSMQSLKGKLADFVDEDAAD
jgi:ribosome biogenesis GTPase / thiamine phosphate phosphatase